MYFIRILIVLLIVIAMVVFGIMFVRWVFRGAPAAVTTKPLQEYAKTDAQVSFLTDGIINGDDMHRQIRITVGRSSRTLEVLRGYRGEVLRRRTFANNETAYNEFLNALRYARFDVERNSSITESSGVCPLGHRYIYSLNGSGADKTDFDLWTTTCGGGTASVQQNLVNQLFQNQITDYTRLISDVNLRATQ